MSGGTIGMLLAITSGLLSLVGLISIFISMNSQHNVQRSREILWSIFTLPYQKGIFLEKGAIGQEVFRKFILYEQIIKEKNAFLRNIIIFAQITLAFCAFIWTIIAYNLLAYTFSPVERSILFIALFLADSLVLYFILRILGVLKSISKVGQLPTVDELLDADSLTVGSNVITLAAVSSRLKIINSQIYIGFPIPFKNLMVHMSIHHSFRSSEAPIGNYDLDLAKWINEFKKLDPQKFQLLNDDYCYYPIYELEALDNGDHRRNIFFANVEFISKQGYVSAEFYNNKELISLGNANFVVYPYTFVEHFINRNSKLDPLSRYIERSGLSPLNSDTEWINARQRFFTLFNKE